MGVQFPKGESVVHTSQNSSQIAHLTPSETKTNSFAQTFFTYLKECFQQLKSLVSSTKTPLAPHLCIDIVKSPPSFPHTAQDAKEYQKLLNNLAGKSFALPLDTNLSEKNMVENPKFKKEDWEKQLIKDAPRTIYQIEGKQIETAEVGEKFREYAPLAQQLITFEMAATLQKKFDAKDNNNDICFTQVSRSVDEVNQGKANTLFNLYHEEGREYLEVRQLFQITDMNNKEKILGYVNARMIIDIKADITHTAFVVTKEPVEFERS